MAMMDILVTESFKELPFENVRDRGSLTLVGLRASCKKGGPLRVHLEWALKIQYTIFLDPHPTLY